MPPAEITYNVETMRKMDFTDFCRKKANLSGKVAGYILDQYLDQLNYTKKLLKDKKE